MSETEYGIRIRRKRCILASGEMREYRYYVCPVCGSPWPSLRSAAECAAEMSGVVTEWPAIESTARIIRSELDRERYLLNTYDKLSAGIRAGALLDAGILGTIRDAVLRIRNGAR